MEHMWHFVRLIVAPVLFSLMLPSNTLAQCNLALSSAGVQEDCDNQSTPLAWAMWSGGTAPFTVSFAISSGLWAQEGANDNFWSSEMALLPPGTQQATIAVIDAMGCQASTEVSWIDHIPMLPDISFTHDCTVGPTLRWSGSFNPPPFSLPSQCPGPFNFNYQMMHLPTGQIWNGSIAADWIAESPSGWHFDQALPAGNYVVDIFRGAALSCSSPFNVECFFPVSALVPSNAGDCGVQFNLRAALAGALPSGTLMGDQLRAAGLIPTTEPYSAMGYTYVGTAPGASLTPSLLAVTGNNAIVDWVVVELRSASNPAAVLHSRPALIQRDGDVMGLNGEAFINAPVASGNYHVAIRHRNHLGIMTASPRALLWGSTATMIDFRLSSTSTYGNEARTTVGSVHCLWPGDATMDGTIRYVGNNNDRDPILIGVGGSVPTNTVSNAYSRLDVNMDGVIRYVGNGNDRDPILTVIGGSTPTNTRTQQLP